MCLYDKTLLREPSGRYKPLQFKQTSITAIDKRHDKAVWLFQPWVFFHSITSKFFVSFYVRKTDATIMLRKMNNLGQKMTSKEMKQMKGGAIIGGGAKCIPGGQPCGGGGCDEPQPVCCRGYVCSGSNGIRYDPGFCVLPGTGGGGVDM